MSINSLCLSIETILKNEVLTKANDPKKQIIYKTIYNNLQNVKELATLLTNESDEIIEEKANELKQSQDLLLQTMIVKWLLTHR